MKTDTLSVKSAKALAQRLLGERADGFAFEEITKDGDKDVFELETRRDKVVIRGNNGVSMAMGLNWYLKEHCKRSVSLRGNNINLPDKLPEIDGVFRKASWAKHRYFLNYCAFGYSMPWWDWSQWERLIDYMALNGINAPLAVTGQEATWQAVCKRLGMTDEQIGGFLAGPPYLPFGWMGCLDGWGGPLPESWIDSHEKLGRQILDRERALGMTPVQQGFTGHVPAALKDKFPDAKMHTVNWVEWTTYLLDPLDPLFQKIADLFMEEQSKRFGSDHMYASDTFIEMTPPSGETSYLENLGKAIFRGMSKSDPEAVWVFQTWTFWHQSKFWTQPRIKAFLDAVPNEQMICLDLACEDRPMWRRAESFHGKPWLWCNIQNYGNKVFLGGGLDKINDGIMEVRHDKDRGNLRGIGFVNEGLGYNPVIHDLMFEMAWRDNDVDIDSWTKRHAGYRYGHSNSDAEQAWKTLRETVYASPIKHPFHFLSVMSRVPGFEEKPDVHYDNNRLAEAWEYMLKASEELGEIDAFQFDLVNIARQVLSNYALVFHKQMEQAYKEKDADAFDVSSKHLLQLFLDIDELVGTREELLLGKNLEDAKRWGQTPDEKAILEWNARQILTLWGTTEINGYARKEWSGLISGYYHKRWQKFIDHINKELLKGEPYDDKRFKKELMTFMEMWSDAHETYPDKPIGSSVDVAQRMWSKYGMNFSF
ncbi:alpha-N-acetylglucosaminidase [Snuella sp. CAU 1569]|uniref:Alpha-N-acetylglucosaminidase n=1 Tax=Snuella sedimenti TaxID=2798802 RepID=A0A8J7J260_9FLAO|nr:alpha-N-acetylglucosaminidase [Snuella sedimenti]